MAKLAALLFTMASSGRQPLPDPPRPAPTPAPRARAETIEIICILDAPAPVTMCDDTFPGLPWLHILKPCPDWIAKIVAEAERL